MNKEMKIILVLASMFASCEGKREKNISSNCMTLDTLFFMFPSLIHHLFSLACRCDESMIHVDKETAWKRARFHSTVEGSLKDRTFEGRTKRETKKLWSNDKIQQLVFLSHSEWIRLLCTNDKCKWLSNEWWKWVDRFEHKKTHEWIF